MLQSFATVTAPTEEPILVSEAAAQVRQDSNADDAYLISLIATVRDAYEREHGMYFCTRTVDIYLSCFPDGNEIRFKRGPLQSVTSVTYVTADGTEETFAATEYDVDTRRGRIVLKYGKQWPSATLRPMDPVIIRAVVGYGSSGQVPPAARHAMLMDLDHFYGHRSSVISGNQANMAQEMARASASLMSPLRSWAL